MIRQRASIARACALAVLIGMAGAQAAGAENHRLSDRARYGGAGSSTLLGDLTHHQGRSFTDRRSELRDRPFLRRHSQVESLRENDVAPRCRTVRTVERDEGRHALVARRVCTDSLETLHVSPGSSHVIKYLDQ